VRGVTPLRGCPVPREGSLLSHHRERALHQRGIEIDAARLQKILDFRGQLVHGRVFGGEPDQGGTEFERGLEIRRTLPPRIGKHEVEYGY